MLERIEAIAAALPDALAVGISNVCSGPDACAAGFAEAQQAARALPVLRPRERHLRYDELGVYKYLLRVPPGDRVRDRHADALRVLAEHDRGATRSSCTRSRSSCASAATWARRPRRSTSTRTRCASGCGASRSSPASTRATPTGSLLEVALKLQRLEEVYPPGQHT